MSIQQSNHRSAERSEAETNSKSDSASRPFNPLRFRVIAVLYRHHRRLKEANTQRRWRQLREAARDVIISATDDMQTRLDVPSRIATLHTERLANKLLNELSSAEELVCCSRNPRYDVDNDAFWQKLAESLLDTIDQREAQLVEAWY